MAEEIIAEADISADGHDEMPFRLGDIVLEKEFAFRLNQIEVEKSLGEKDPRVIQNMNLKILLLQVHGFRIFCIFMQHYMLVFYLTIK